MMEMILFIIFFYLFLALVYFYNTQILPFSLSLYFHSEKLFYIYKELCIAIFHTRNLDSFLSTNDFYDNLPLTVLD